MTRATVDLKNPFWDEVKERVRRDNDYGVDFGLCVGGIDDLGALTSRTDLTSRYAWTITAPETVSFVAEHLGIAAIDPLAGSGYWTYLLTQAGVNVLSSDIAPAGSGQPNRHHRHKAWMPIFQDNAVNAVTRAASGRSLLLSWPPYADKVGAELVAALKGDRIVYIGEGDGGCCGDDDMFTLLDEGWTEVDSHRPVQFWGLHDYVTVYDRKKT